jgi:hypothetical protein
MTYLSLYVSLLAPEGVRIMGGTLRRPSMATLKMGRSLGAKREGPALVVARDKRKTMRAGNERRGRKAPAENTAVAAKIRVGVE